MKPKITKEQGETMKEQAIDWINNQNTYYARTLQEKAKYLVGKIIPAEMPHPAIWNYVLKIAYNNV
jgi:hypothetical protein